MTIDTLLTTTFPDLPDEVKLYVSGVLTQNSEDFHSLEDVHSAIGELLLASAGDIEQQDVDDLCEKVYELMGGSSSSNLIVGSPGRRVLDGPVHLGDSCTKNSQPEHASIWSQSRRDDRNKVDPKKLEKAEAKIKEKQDKRIALGSSTDPKVKMQDVGATASQAANRKDARLEAKGQANNLEVRLENVDLSFGDKELLRSATLFLAFGRRYGLVGRNGIGKTTLLKMISSGQLSIPSCIRMLHVVQEVEGDDTKVIDSVLSCDTFREQLLQEEKRLQEQIAGKTEDCEQLASRLTKVYQDLEQSDAAKAPARAASILFGLGFSVENQQSPTREFSGGWRMRLALARGLFMKPDLLLLDEPTNMLDMKAIYWLENYLQDWPSTLFVVSHDRNFLNAVCNDIIHMHSKRLETYRGNYDNFEKSMDEKLTQQQREYEAQQQLRAHAQAFIDKFRYNAKRASLAQSKIKMLERLPVLVPVERESLVKLKFPECEVLHPPVLQLDEAKFTYDAAKPPIFESICVNADTDARICIVGDNGAGKTTLLKLLMGELQPTNGIRNAHRHLKVGYFAQHHVDQLEMDTSALELAAKKFPGFPSELYRAALGRFGLSGDLALQSVASLSGGQKSRLAFALLGMQNPNFLIMDEPTNHLDVESVEALGKCLCEFTGGVVLVSHDERLIEIVCKELWVVKDKRVIRLEGGLPEYKRLICKQLAAMNAS